MASIPRSLQKLIDHLGKLPGVGPKTAARLGFYLLQSPDDELVDFAKTLETIKSSIKTCEECFNISEDVRCAICRDTTRNKTVICVVEEPLDIIALEKTGIFQGVYHVLQGVISPLHGVGPEDLTISSLKEKIARGGITEVILATNANVEGEATALYITKQLPESLEITRLAAGLPFGSDVEYTDELTLSQAINNRRKVR